jgi:trehalose 6-phosphate synthase/phosphatase
VEYLNTPANGMRDLLINCFKEAKNRLVLLDYDGTLVDYQRSPLDAVPSRQLLGFLLRLNALPQTRLLIITGRAFAEIDGFIGDLPIDIIAEHGAMVRENRHWHELVEDDGHWKKEIGPVLDRFATACPGSFVEEKRFSMAWHYRNAAEEKGISDSRAVIAALQEITGRLGLKITDGNKVVEVKKQGIDKGMGVRYALQQGVYDFALAIGDDKTDEDMFAALVNNKHAFTIKVGIGDTLAQYRLDNVPQVIALLNELI